jgi:hypothetical protein
MAYRGAASGEDWGQTAEISLPKRIPSNQAMLFSRISALARELNGLRSDANKCQQP